MTKVRIPRKCAFAAPVTEKGIVQTLRNLLRTIDIQRSRQVTLQKEYFLVMKNQKSWRIITSKGTVLINFKKGYTFSHKCNIHGLFMVAATAIKKIAAERAYDA